MKAIVIGLGVQGQKRKKTLQKKGFYVCSVDPLNKEAEEKKISQIEKYKYDTVFICVPDKEKEKYVDIFINKKINIFIEKPFLVNDEKMKLYEKLSNINKKYFYIAYNHRFEPHLMKVKKILFDKNIGDIYYLNIFYGNGTAKLVKNSWRNKNFLIEYDLGSHLVDLLLFFFNKKKITLKYLNKKSLENKKPDWALMLLNCGKIKVKFEMTYCCWENTFNFLVVGSKGLVKIDNLCKWGDSTIKIEKRIFPSGYPKLVKKVLRIKDPTWMSELNFFNKNIVNNKKVNLKKDMIINKILKGNNF